MSTHYGKDPLDPAGFVVKFEDTASGYPVPLPAGWVSQTLLQYNTFVAAQAAIMSASESLVAATAASAHGKLIALGFTKAEANLVTGYDPDDDGDGPGDGDLDGDA